MATIKYFYIGDDLRLLFPSSVACCMLFAIPEASSKALLFLNAGAVDILSPCEALSSAWHIAKGGLIRNTSWWMRSVPRW